MSEARRAAGPVKAAVGDEELFELAYGLRAIIARLGRRLNVSSSIEGLTPTQASVLQVLAHRGPLRLGDLTALEGLNPTMLSRIVGKLDEAGLIQRIPDPDDARAARVQATGQGLHVAEEIRNARSRVVADALESLPAATRDLLREALPALIDLGDALS